MALILDDSPELVLLSGSTEDVTLPPRINTELPATELGTADTPDGYGFDLDNDGVISKGTQPSGTSRVQKAVVIDGLTYYWHYRRLWRFSGTFLEVGAMDYDDIWRQEGPRMEFNEDAQPILAIVPFGEDNMLVVKSTGSYVLQNTFDTRGPGFFNRGPLVQEMRAAAANRVAELDGAVYASNDDGVFSYSAGRDEAVEVTRLARGLSSSIWGGALTVDYDKKRIIVGSSAAIVGSNVYRYSGNSFWYTTPELRHASYNPISVGAIVFVVRHPSSSFGNIKYQTRTEGGNWSSVQTVGVPYQRDGFTIVRADVPDPDDDACRRFQLRITDIGGSKQIERIYAYAQTHEFDIGTR